MNNVYRSIFLIVLLLAFASPSKALAVSMFLSPQAGSYNLSTLFSVDVLVTTTETPANAFSGTLSFPSEKLEVVSITKNNSIINFWPQEPSYSNSGGTINFEGVVLNPGYFGSNGKVITIQFRTKTAGKIPVRFESSSVLANDGNGTEILKSIGNGEYNVAISTDRPEAVSGVAPEIISSTHPDQLKWYAHNSPQFSWDLPSSVVSTRTLLSKGVSDLPTVTHIPPASSRTYDSIEDGIWYFHARYKIGDTWGPVSHFKIQIDRGKPDPVQITFPAGTILTTARPEIVFDSRDNGSGIDHYEIKIGDAPFFRVERDAAGKPYVLPVQKPGTRTILVRAHDKAGNQSLGEAEFTVTPIAAPQLTVYPRKVAKSEHFQVGGITYPNSTVAVTIQNEYGKSEVTETTSNASGSFDLIWITDLKEGSYTLSAVVTDTDGAMSLPSKGIPFVVEGQSWTQKGWSLANSLLLVLIILVLIVGIIFFVCKMWHRGRLLSVRMSKEIREAQEITHKAFNVLREDLSTYLNYVDRDQDRKQTEREKQLVQRLKKDLNDAEKIIGKEIRDIDKKKK